MDTPCNTKLDIFREQLTLMYVIKAGRNSNYTRYYAFGLGAKWRYVGYFASSLHPPGIEIWLLSWLKGMPGRLEKPCCTKLPVAGFL